MAWSMQGWGPLEEWQQPCRFGTDYLQGPFGILGPLALNKEPHKPKYITFFSSNFTNNNELFHCIDPELLSTKTVVISNVLFYGP